MALKKKKSNRKLTLKKKAGELATLCDVSVCMVSFGADGEVETWPDNKTQVLDMINKYKRISDQKGKGKEKEKAKQIHKLDLSGTFLETKKENLEEKFNQESIIGIMGLNWDDEKLKHVSMEELMGLCSSLDSKLQNLSERIDVLQNKGKENAVLQVCNGDIGTVTNPNDDINMLMNECYQPLLPLLFNQEAFDHPLMVQFGPVVLTVMLNYSRNFGQNYNNLLEGVINNNLSLWFGHAITGSMQPGN